MTKNTLKNIPQIFHAVLSFYFPKNRRRYGETVSSVITQYLGISTDKYGRFRSEEFWPFDIIIDREAFNNDTRFNALDATSPNCFPDALISLVGILREEYSESKDLAIARIISLLRANGIEYEELEAYAEIAPSYRDFLKALARQGIRSATNKQSNTCQMLSAWGKDAHREDEGQSASFVETRYIISVKKALELIKRYNDKTFYKRIEELVTQADPQLDGSFQDYHALIRRYLDQGLFISASKIINHAQKLFPNNAIDLWIDEIAAIPYHAGFNTEELEHLLKPLKALTERCVRDRQMFLRVIDACIRPLSICGDTTKRDDISNVVIECINSYKELHAADESAWYAEARVKLACGKTDDAKRLLKQVVYADSYAPKCCELYLREFLNSIEEYDEIIKVAKKGWNDSFILQPFDSRASFAYRMAYAYEKKSEPPYGNPALAENAKNWNERAITDDSTLNDAIMEQRKRLNERIASRSNLQPEKAP